MNIVKPSSDMLSQSIPYLKKALTLNEILPEQLITTEYSVEDELTISQEARARFDKERYDYAEMLRQIKETEAPKEEDPLFKCIKIAMRVMNGDNVPSKDKSFLLEHQPQMYTNSMLLKRKNKDPKDYKSLIKDEEDDTPAKDISEGGSTESISVDSMKAEVEVNVDVDA